MNGLIYIYLKAWIMHKGWPPSGCGNTITKDPTQLLAACHRGNYCWQLNSLFKRLVNNGGITQGAAISVASACSLLRILSKPLLLRPRPVRSRGFCPQRTRNPRICRKRAGSSVLCCTCSLLHLFIVAPAYSCT